MAETPGKNPPESLRLGTPRTEGLTLKRPLVGAAMVVFGALFCLMVMLQSPSRKNEGPKLLAPVPDRHGGDLPVPKADYRELTREPAPPPQAPPLPELLPPPAPFSLPEPPPLPEPVDLAAERRRIAYEQDKEAARRSETTVFKRERTPPRALGPGQGGAAGRVISAGTSIPAVLITPLDSNISGVVQARVAAPVQGFGRRRELLVPEGALLIGRYQGRAARGQERIAVQWQTLVLAAGRSLAVDDLETLDTRGYSGLPAQVEHHYGQQLVSGVLTSLLNVVPSMLGGGYGYNTGRPVEHALTGAAVDFGGRVITPPDAIPPTLRIPAGTPFDVLVMRDLTIPR